MPDFHNPTGLVMDGDARRHVMRRLEQAGALTVIDETFVELDLDDVALPAPAASFGNGRTITIGSLSKSIWGGLRVGWARGDPGLIHRMAIVRAASDLASPLFEQIVAASALDRLDEILAERREVIRTRRAALAEALDERLPSWSYALPPGGLFLWAELPDPISTSLSLEASPARAVHHAGAAFRRGRGARAPPAASVHAGARPARARGRDPGRAHALGRGSARAGGARRIRCVRVSVHTKRE